ncbi:hypothetical protein GCK32_001020 [Trichostrongylus colubriformis]|uniref:Uncharacterized protein n=1 Tax=Trichostrongylus colubriformis TaxID=6319 RepID=A0AAN8ENL7_TRICO
MAHQVFSSNEADEAERNDVLFYFSRKDEYKQRRNALWRVTSKLHDSRVTMEDVPRGYPFLADRSPFLQMRTDDLHIYCSTCSVESMPRHVRVGGGRRPRPSDGSHQQDGAIVYYP